MLKLTRSKQVQLAELADDTIRRTLAGDEGVPAAANLLEAIGATVSTALPATGDAWRSVLQPLGVRVNVIGVFSFGCPKVELIEAGSTRRCDLGSLLAIVDDLTGSVVDRRALFLALRLQGPAPEPNQQRLYGKWPAFRLTDGAYRDGLRDIRAPKAKSAGRFFELDLSRNEPNWTLLNASATGPGSQGSLGRLLAAMIIGAGGREATTGGLDVWSRTVGELLNRTANATVGGLRHEPGVRSATTYEGESGSGLVLLENRAELPLESALVEAAARGLAFPEGPMSVVHVIFRDA